MHDSSMKCSCNEQRILTNSNTPSAGTAEQNAANPLTWDWASSVANAPVVLVWTCSITAVRNSLPPLRLGKRKLFNGINFLTKHVWIAVASVIVGSSVQTCYVVHACCPTYYQHQGVDTDPSQTAQHDRVTTVSVQFRKHIATALPKGLFYQQAIAERVTQLHRFCLNHTVSVASDCIFASASFVSSDAEKPPLCGVVKSKQEITVQSNGSNRPASVGPKRDSSFIDRTGEK